MGFCVAANAAKGRQLKLPNSGKRQTPYIGLPCHWPTVSPLVNHPALLVNFDNRRTQASAFRWH